MAARAAGWLAPASLQHPRPGRLRCRHCCHPLYLLPCCLQPGVVCSFLQLQCSCPLDPAGCSRLPPRVIAAAALTVTGAATGCTLFSLTNTFCALAHSSRTSASLRGLHCSSCSMARSRSLYCSRSIDAMLGALREPPGWRRLQGCRQEWSATRSGGGPCRCAAQTRPTGPASQLQGSTGAAGRDGGFDRAGAREGRLERRSHGNLGQSSRSSPPPPPFAQPQRSLAPPQHVHRVREPALGLPQS